MAPGAVKLRESLQQSWRIYRLLREQQPSLKVILVSGYDPDKTRGKNGPQPYFTKTLFIGKPH